MTPRLEYHCTPFVCEQTDRSARMMSKSPVFSGSNVKSSQDVALWLHNKLGSSDANWCSSQLASQLNENNLCFVPRAFGNLAPPVKYRLLMAFLFIPKRNLKDVKEFLEEVVQLGISDEDTWVSAISQALEQYFAQGHIPLDSLLSVPAFEQVANELKSSLAAVDSSSKLLPMECPLLCQRALSRVISGEAPLPDKHFSLRQKAKSYSQRSELLQKCKDLQLHSETMANSRTNRGAALISNNSVPMRNKTAPSRLKFGLSKGNESLLSGKPATGPVSDGVVNRHKDLKRGAKLIEITDQPLGGPGRLKRQKSMGVEVTTAAHVKNENEENRTIDETLSSPNKNDLETQHQTLTVCSPTKTSPVSVKAEAGRQQPQTPQYYNDSEPMTPGNSYNPQFEQQTVPEYMLGLQTFPSPNEHNSLATGFNNFNPGYTQQNVFQSLGSSNQSGGLSANQSHFSPFEHDYAPTSKAARDHNLTFSYSPSPSHAHNGKVSADMYPGNNSSSPMFNYFQPTSQTSGSGDSPDRASSTVRSIADQLKEMVDQNANNSSLAMQQIQPANQPILNRMNLSMSNTIQRPPNMAKQMPGAGAGNTAAASGRSSLDKLLSSATKLTDVDRQKIQRFLNGETSADEANPNQSKVSVTLSEMRVPAEIKGELCTSVISTVFEMDYGNRKWKVVKHTNVIKAPSKLK